MLLLLLQMVRLVTLDYVDNFHLRGGSQTDLRWMSRKETLEPSASFAIEPLRAPEPPYALERPQQNAKGSRNKLLGISVEH